MKQCDQERVLFANTVSHSNGEWIEFRTSSNWKDARLDYVCVRGMLRRRKVKPSGEIRFRSSAGYTVWFRRVD
jgi:hypothetical protein